MLTDIILAVDGKKPEKLSCLDDIYGYRGKKKFKKMKSFQAVADTRDMSLAYLGDTFPGLQRLHLNNSIISSIRDLRSNLPNLVVLSLAHCGLSELDGISTISGKLQELYLAFNKIEDVSELLGMTSLKILDLESNLIPYVEDVEILKCLTRLRNLTLRGNGCEEHPEYRKEIKRLIPKLVYLDEIKFGEENKESEENNEPKVEEIQPNDETGNKDEINQNGDNTSNEANPNGEKLPDLNNNKKLPPLRSAKEPYRDRTVVTDLVRDRADKRPPTTNATGSTTSRIAVRAPSRMIPRQRVVKPKIWHNIGSIRL
ncbi:hypothetical protein TRFO_26080 [Tritrichomonas foetus]|uniref:Leucine Rich Repeat family protein n=1 Tax=Tritrichomonas foetus TaxID=1144522 RepID=A0A1J4K3Q3_9EUKA|nr:hypothetical protein TRFO_26080 [Tritrichomonas foetus]|eukprot:OHT06007.1 hypothetical protein TRFO_26080 [Tritrichomonas foetus]